MRPFAYRWAPAWAALTLLAACGGGQEAPSDPKADFLPAQGQVTLSATTPTNATRYAAARFLEQASWGPTPAAIAEVQSLGMAGWIDKQLKLAPTQLNAPDYVISHDIFNQAEAERARDWFTLRSYDAFLSGQDQLRQRVAWALFNFIPVGFVQPYGNAEYFNMLHRQALGTFKDLLREVTLHPSMGMFLNNDQNEANRPNENYARELMQLFSVGLVMLNPDGTARRTNSGAPIETYSQQDVIQATKALSGWKSIQEEKLPRSNLGNFGKRMVPKEWDGAHDRSAKTVLGKAIPANQTIEQDLESLLDILVNHPNTAPFVVRRLIQSLVSSDPSPAYMTRISRVFVASKGDLAQTVRAILLDTEARSGDVVGVLDSRVGKMKEPLLAHLNLLRGLGCRVAVTQHNNAARPTTSSQDAYYAPSVFGYFPPNHKTPETQSAAPEQKLLTPREFNFLGNYGRQLTEDRYKTAGCESDLFIAAAARSDDALLALINERFFRGAMPATLRYAALNLLKGRLANEEPARRFGDLMGILLLTPSFGAVR